MAKNVDSPEIARSRLRALRAEKPATQMGQIRWAWPEIRAALDMGHSLTTVHQRLAEVGIDIPYRRLSFYIGRLRREQNQSPNAIPSAAQPVPAAVYTDSGPVSASAARPTGESARNNRTAERDPLANLRKLSNNRPGFQWDEVPPDKDKLF